MRLTVEVDDKLMKRAMKAAGTSTKRGTITAALELLVRISGQKAIRRLRGKIDWVGNIDAMRRD